MSFSLEDLSSQVVVIGNFNPPIFTPHWLASNGLIGEDDVGSANSHESLAINQELARFETEKFMLQVIRQQFMIASKGPITPAFMDLLLGMFSLIPQTPVTAIGLNYLGTYKILKVDDYHKVGDVLAPKTVWDKLGLYENGSVGMATLSVQFEPHPRDQPLGVDDPMSGRKKILSISPIAEKKAHVQFVLNNHFPIKATKTEPSAVVMAEIIKENWEANLNDAPKKFEIVLNESLAN